MSPRPNSGDHLTMDAVMKPAPVTVVDNPYLIGLGKKTRGLKKKLHRIERTEEIRAAGKPINSEQLKLLESKSAVEVALAEHDRVRSAIEEVDRELRAKAIAETRNTSPASAVSPTSSDSQTDAMFTLASSDEADNESGSVDAPKELPEQANAEPANVTAQEGPAKQPNIDSTSVVAEKETPSKPPRMESVGVATDPCPTEHASVQTDLSGPPPPPGLDPSKVANELATAALIAAQDKEKAVVEAEARGLAAGRAEMATGLTKIFSLLHAAVRCKSKGEPLPSAVDFFSKVLVGKTIPPDEADFDGGVEYSVERARLFVNPAYSSHEVAPGTTIKNLEDIVSSIREEIINGPAALEEPVFNFFADSCPAEPSGDSSTAASATSSPNETFVTQPPPSTLMAENHRDNARLQTQPPAPITVHGKEDAGHQVQPPPPTLTTEREHQAPPPPTLTIEREHQAPPPPTLTTEHEHQAPPPSTLTTEREHQAPPPPTLTTEREKEHQPPPPPSLSPRMTEHNTPPPKVPVPPHGGQHSMVLSLPRPQVPPQHPVKTKSPSSPSPRHVTGQDVGMRTHESGFLGRQASEMEEGVLPPVVKQEHSRPPPTAVVNGDSALPKRERRQRFRSRGPPPPPPFSPPFSPGPSGGGGVYMISQPPNLSPTMHRQQQVRPIFLYQHPSPPLTPLQAGQGFVPQAPSPSPPAPGTPQSLPPEGSTNGGYANGWGYQHHTPQEALFVQNQWYQRNIYGRPMHPAPMHVHSEPVAGAPWGQGGVTLSPSNQYSPEVSPSCRTVNGPPRHTKGEMSHHFSNGFTVTSDRANTDRDSPTVVEVETEPPPIPTDSGPFGQPSGFTPAVEHTPPSVQPPPGAPPSSSLAQEFPSPPQEVSPSFKADNRPPRHTKGEMSQHFSNGFAVTSDRANTDRDSPTIVEVETEPPPIPTDSGPFGQPSGFTPAGEHTPPSVQPPPGAPPSSSLAQEVPSPPQEVSTSFKADNRPPRHTKGEMSQDFSNGFAVTSDRADTDRDSPAVVETETEPPPIPTDSGPLGQPSGFTPAVEHTPPSVQPPPGAPPTSSSAQEVASPPQGHPRGAKVGPRPAIIDATRDSVARGSDGERALGAESAGERGRGLVDEDHHPQEQHARSNGVVPALAEVVSSPETSGAPASIEKSVVSDTLMTCTNREVPAGSVKASGEGAAGKPRAGGKGRGSHSRARATKRAELRVTASKDGRNGDVPPQAKPVTKGGRSQRRARDERRGQPLQRQEEIKAPITAHDQAVHTPPQAPEGRGASKHQHESKSVVSTPLAVPSTVTLQPKASSRTPVSSSWADEIPSPRAQPAQQRWRGSGGGRNRRTPKQTSPTSHDVENLQTGRNSRNKLREPTRASANDHSGRKYPGKQGQPKANDALNNRSLDVASQGPGNHKVRASPYRRKGGGNGSNENGNGGGRVQHSL